MQKFQTTFLKQINDARIFPNDLSILIYQYINNSSTLVAWILDECKEYKEKTILNINRLCDSEDDNDIYNECDCENAPKWFSTWLKFDIDHTVKIKETKFNDAYNSYCLTYQGHVEGRFCQVTNIGCGNHCPDATYWLQNI